MKTGFPFEKLTERTQEMVAKFKAKYPLDDAVTERLMSPCFAFLGQDLWEMSVLALLAGKNLLLVGEKATGKNVLAQNLAYLFNRPIWDISFHVNIDAMTLLGSDTLRDGNVNFRPGPIYQCAVYGGFGILDEINMAKNEAVAVLHAVLDFRRVVDVPGYDRIYLHPATRFIATMNQDYLGTRPLNEALLSRFAVIAMPPLDKERVMILLQRQFPGRVEKELNSYALLYDDIRKKVAGGEISSSALDFRGLLDALQMMELGMHQGDAINLGLVNKCFDPYERELVNDLIRSRFPSIHKR
ncbi:MAG: MoxR family ATPase [Christensenellaceae bacterium]|nr:MoxR family ATPase [Christensenellaceae bacterium]